MRRGVPRRPPTSICVQLQLLQTHFDEYLLWCIGTKLYSDILKRFWSRIRTRVDSIEFDKRILKKFATGLNQGMKETHFLVALDPFCRRGRYWNFVQCYSNSSKRKKKWFQTESKLKLIKVCTYFYVLEEPTEQFFIRERLHAPNEGG